MRPARLTLLISLTSMLCLRENEFMTPTSALSYSSEHNLAGPNLQYTKYL